MTVTAASRLGLNIATIDSRKTSTRSLLIARTPSGERVIAPHHDRHRSNQNVATSPSSESDEAMRGEQQPSEATPQRALILDSASLLFWPYTQRARQQRTGI